MIKILVVDDDKDLNRLVCSYLNDSGFSTTGCLSVNEAYDEMYSNLYDLIISDISFNNLSTLSSSSLRSTRITACVNSYKTSQ